MDKKALTDETFWNDYWQNVSLPAEMKKTKDDIFQNILLETFDKYLPVSENISILEIGGSPGRYLVYMHKNFGYRIHSLDYSEKGYEKTLENFKLLNIPIEVYNNDLFSEELILTEFDIVYSLGFIEHFYDLNSVIERHLKFLKPGGILLIGVPNYLGINKWFLEKVAPKLLSVHNLAAMDSKNWKSFEEKFSLEVIFKDYIGGFEPQSFNRWEEKNIKTFILKVTAKLLSLLLHSRFKFLRKYNSKNFSAYLIGIYRKP